MTDDSSVRDKYADRLDDPASDGTDNQDDQREVSGKNDESSGNEWNDGNVKKDWNGWTVYLPDELDESFEDEFNRLQYELDRSIQKDRHYKPLMIALALDRLERMESSEVTAFLERMERRELQLFEE